GDLRFASDQREARKPFSFGPRNCTGMNLAYTEMRCILSRINRDSEMRLSGESRRWIELQEARVVWEKPASKVY
ncbi:hypothetical protein BDP67DRAFT_423510, partial [Colletotrichum lupini]